MPYSGISASTLLLTRLFLPSWDSSKHPNSEHVRGNKARTAIEIQAFRACSLLAIACHAERVKVRSEQICPEASCAQRLAADTSMARTVSECGVELARGGG